MTAAERLIRVAVLLVPPARRPIRREEWLADLAGAEELGMPRSAIVSGAFRAAAAEGIRRLSPRRALATVAVALGIVVVGAPVAGFAAYLISDARGVVTVEPTADGGTREVHWRDYPGIPELEPADILDGPSLEEGVASGCDLLGEIEAALSAELGLEWAPAAGRGYDEHPTAQNYYGGSSILAIVNLASRQSTTVPETWAGKRQAITIIEEVAQRYGFGGLALDHDAAWMTPEEAESSFGGTTPETSVIVAGVLTAPNGQWLSFSIQDLSLDRTGRFAEQAELSAEHGWMPNSLTLMYGANGLLPEGDRAEFERRLVPYAGLERPEPLPS